MFRMRIYALRYILFERSHNVVIPGFHIWNPKNK